MLFEIVVISFIKGIAVSEVRLCCIVYLRLIVLMSIIGNDVLNYPNTF